VVQYSSGNVKATVFSVWGFYASMLWATSRVFDVELLELLQLSSEESRE